jgi:hypothetical protein
MADIALFKKEPPSTDDMLEVLESLKEQIVAGEIIAYAIVGIEPDDCTRMWSAAIPKVTRLRMMGAIYNLLHSYTAGE